MIKILSIMHYLIHMQNLFQSGANDASEMGNIIYRFLSRRSKFGAVQLGSSDLVFKFCQLGVNIVNIQKVFWTYTISNSKNMKELELERRIP